MVEEPVHHAHFSIFPHSAFTCTQALRAHMRLFTPPLFYAHRICVIALHGRSCISATPPRLRMCAHLPAQESATAHRKREPGDLSIKWLVGVKPVRGSTFFFAELHVPAMPIFIETCSYVCDFTFVRAMSLDLAHVPSCVWRGSFHPPRLTSSLTG